jgi:hypothetical protein
VYLYQQELRLPDQLAVLGSYAAAYTSTEAASRPLAANARRSGFVSDLRAEVGLLPWLAAYGVGRLAPPLEGEQAPRGAGEGGLRFKLPIDSRSFRLGFEAGAGADFQRVPVAMARVIAGYDVGRFRLGGLLHTEKAFDLARDELDVWIASGVMVETIRGLRAGVEYVGQDLEDFWEVEEAEGGARHFAGLSVSWVSDRWSVVGGPAFGLNDIAPDVLGRAQGTYRF